MSQLLSALPVGAKIKDPGALYDGEPLKWRVLEHGHSGDPTGTTTLQADIVLCLKAFDAKEPNNSDSNRKSYGNNRYRYSNLLQWLNSSGAANEWYSAQHTADQAPDSTSVVSQNPYSGEKGFMAYLTDVFKAALQSTTKKTALNTVTDGGGSEDVTSKIFLLSTTEVGLADENSIAEGTIYSYYSADNQNSRRIMKDKNGTARGWWLRTPSSSGSDSARYVGTDGSRSYSFAYGGYYGAVPACCVLSSLTVSSEPDSDGYYTLNCAPEITVNHDDFGNRNLGFDLKYTVTDEESDPTEVTVALDGSTVQHYDSITLGQEYTYSVSNGVMDALAAGNHSITITAYDGISTVVKTCVFTKVVTLVEISGEDGPLGNIWTAPTVKYQVSDPGNPVTVTEYIDNVLTNTISPATPKTDITFDVSTYENLSDENTHTLKIQATDGNMTATRTYTFKKLPEELILTTNAIATDVAANSVNVILRYTTTNNPTVKVEASNDSGTTWENMTSEWAAGEAHEFVNKPADNLGIKVRITITKNENTERVYLNAFGFSFT